MPNRKELPRTPAVETGDGKDAQREWPEDSPERNLEAEERPLGRKSRILSRLGMLVQLHPRARG